MSWEERTVGEVGRVAVGGEIVRKDLTDSEMGQHEVLTSFEWRCRWSMADGREVEGGVERTFAFRSSRPKTSGQKRSALVLS